MPKWSVDSRFFFVSPYVRSNVLLFSSHFPMCEKRSWKEVQNSFLHFIIVNDGRVFFLLLLSSGGAAAARSCLFGGRLRGLLLAHDVCVPLLALLLAKSGVPGLIRGLLPGLLFLGVFGTGQVALVTTGHVCK